MYGCFRLHRYPGSRPSRACLETKLAIHISMKRIIISSMTLAAIILAGCHSHKHEDHLTGHTHEQTEADANANDHESVSNGTHSGTEGKAHAGEIHFTDEQAEASGLEIEIIKPAPFRSVLRTGGQIQALQGEEQTIVATSGGVIQFTNASITEGTAVSKGETIASISARNLQDGDPVQKAKLAFETAEREFHRAERLVADKIISDKEFDQTRMNYETAKAAYEGQAGNLTAKGVSIKAPISGYIKNRLVAQGDYVSLGQPIAVVAQNSRLQLRADVSESNFHYLRSIQSANFQTAYDDNVYRLEDLNGRLLSYGKTATGRASYIPVTFEFDNIGDFVPGAFANVYLLSAPKENVLSIPVSSLTEEQGLMFVYLHTTDDIYKKQEVAIGQNDGTRVEVLHGLNPGDRVVTRGAYQVKLASMSTAIPGHSHSH